MTDTNYVSGIFYIHYVSSSYPGGIELLKLSIKFGLIQGFEFKNETLYLKTNDGSTETKYWALNLSSLEKNIKPISKPSTYRCLSRSAAKS